MRPYERLYKVSEQLIGCVDEALSQGVIEKKRALLRLEGTQAWLDSENEDRSNIFLKNAWDPLDPLFCAFDETGEDIYLAPLLHIVGDWCRTFDSLDISDKLKAAGQSEDLVWYDMGAGLRLYRLAYLIDVLTQRSTEPELRATMLDSFALHHAYLADDANFRQNNHGLYQAFGQIAAGSRLAPIGVPGSTEMEAQGRTRFAGILEGQFAPEGIHLEHSPGYQTATTQILQNLTRTRLIEDKYVLGLVDRLVKNNKFFFVPGGQPVNFGDTDQRDERLKVACPIAPGEVQTAAFPQGGYWILRARPADHLGEKKEVGEADDARVSYIALMAAFHTRTHKHCDDGSFVWYHEGRPVLIDGGRFGYGGKQAQKSPLWYDGYWYADPERVHLERPRAHNTVEIDARNPPRRKVDPPGSGILKSGCVALAPDGASGGIGDTVHFVDCTNAALGFGSDTAEGAPAPTVPVDHRRLLIVLPGAWIVCIDRMTAGTPVSARQWFNLAARFQLRRWLPDRAVVADEATGETVTLASLTDEVGPVEMGHGWRGSGTEGLYPDMLGWHSTTGGSFHPNLALAMGAEALRDTWTIATLIAPGNVDADRDYTRVNATARRGRFRFVQDGQIYTLSYDREDKEAGVQVEVKVS